MYKIHNIQCKSGIKPLLLFSTTALEYYFGWKSYRIASLEKQDYIPKTPYLNVNKFKKRSRLYTRTMMKELIDLVDIHYPVYYKGGDPILKEVYKRKIIEYKTKVKALQEKWSSEDYFENEEAENIRKDDNASAE